MNLPTSHLIKVSLLLGVILLAPGCRTGTTSPAASVVFGTPETTSATKAKPLKATTAEGADFKSYRIATVLPFSMEAGDGVDPLIGDDFADDIYERLRNSFPGLFEVVRKGPVLGAKDELVITGTITKYAAGSKAARAIGPLTAPFGAAKFDGELSLKAGNNGEILLAAPIKKLWNMYGAEGASKGIDNMMVEAAAAAASTIAHAKGWQPAK